MTSKIFKTIVPNELLFNLLEEICIIKNNDNISQYTFDTASFKKGIFNNSIPVFVEELKNYYHTNKWMYLERNMTYNYFTTILRHICKFNIIAFTTEMRYDKSTYEIIYLIQKS